MRERRMGTDTVPVIGLGCMGMSEFYGPSDREKNLAVLHHALDHDIAFFDTADMYGRGANEQLVGEALRGRRDRAFVATKFGLVREDGGFIAGVNGRPEYIRKQAEGSLRRLGIETIDLYYQHRVDPDTPIEESVGTMGRLVEEGKVRYLGLSEAAPSTIRRAHAEHPITALQTEYSLWSRDPERELLPLTAELGITFVAYSPLGRGFLTGAILSVDELAPDDNRRNHERFQPENFEANLAIVRKVEAIARARGITPAQLALAWVLARASNLVAIPGTRSIQRLDENAASAEIVLTTQEIAELDAAVPPGVASGRRYPERSMTMVDR